MIRIQQLKLPVGHTGEELEEKVRRKLRLKPGEPLSFEIRRRSVDARKKPELYYSYVIDCKSAQESRILRHAGDGLLAVTEETYRFPKPGELKMGHRPVIVGSGPAGLFCGLMLARYGYRPLILERGQDVDTRVRDVARFWETGTLSPESNVQFGEGGAGTFSDGKLNTLVKDREGRNREVLRLFVEAGADPAILYESRPHIGTDVLLKVVKRLRMQIESAGGTIRFSAKVTGFEQRYGRLTALLVNGSERLACDLAILAIGHSARDTFAMLYENGICMEAKDFAVGFRVEHLQEKINLSQYGRKDPSPLQAAPYKLAAKAKNGRNVYSFCMCPGGYVVNASSEDGRLAVNGMSYSGRNGTNANSAVIVSVGKEDFPGEHPLSGVAFQRRIEEAAYRAGGGRIPVQRLGELRERFCAPRLSGDSGADALRPEAALPRSEDRGRLFPCVKGSYTFADLSDILPAELTEAFLDGMEQFSHKIRGFADADTLVSAVESRTSSPVRIPRDTGLESSVKGLYPCGEGAGYAGGITSAAMDGLRIAEAIAGKYSPLKEGAEG